MSRYINKDLLLANGWEIRRGISPEDDYFIAHICDNKYHLELCYFSNMINRKWNIHVDNEEFMSIGNCDINTTDHFNDFMKLLEIPYELQG